MAGMAIGSACSDGSAGVQAFVAPATTVAAVNDGAGALGVDTGFDAVAAGGSSAAGADRLDALLDAARTQLQADTGGRDPLARVRLLVAGDDTHFGRQQQQLLDKLDRFVGTLDEHELAAIEELLRRGQQSGGFSPAELARVMIQVEGSAAGLPAGYLAAADSAQQMAVQMEQDVEQLTAQLNEVLAGPDGSSREAMHLLEQLQQYADGLQLLQERLRSNFELAMQDPTLALQRLQAGLQGAGAGAAA